MKALAAPWVTAVWAVLAAMASSCASVDRPPVACVAKVNTAALKAMGQTGPLGQVQIWGDPVSMGPNHLRVDAKVFSGGVYYVDVMVDPHCNVFSVSTTLESNGQP